MSKAERVRNVDNVLDQATHLISGDPKIVINRQNPTPLDKFWYFMTTGLALDPKGENKKFSFIVWKDELNRPSGDLTS